MPSTEQISPDPAASKGETNAGSGAAPPEKPTYRACKLAGADASAIDSGTHEQNLDYLYSFEDIFFS